VGIVADDGIVPMRPAGLARPRAGVPDNLTRIRGIGERNEVRLNNLGIYHFGQIASWTPAEVRWIGQYLAFPERIERDDWVGQAMILASGGDTGFEKSAERRRRRRREKQVGADTTQLASDVEAVMGRRRSTPRPDDDSDED
jgi:nucleotidyltransferase/DNA polymerase involved in DNA repair